MIPALNHSGVLPPFIPEKGPQSSAAMAPYATSIVDIAKNFANTPDRIAIFLGLLDYRAKLIQSGITNGFQWIAGSYLEDCEKIRSRSPKDVDVVTFSHRPFGCEDQSEWFNFVQNNGDLFNNSKIKIDHKCDTYFVDMGLAAEALVSRSRFWFGLFSHQRDTYLWKGILQVPLIDDDQKARALAIEDLKNA